MPAYEYQCQSCENRFERRQKMSDPELDACPACGGSVQRLISGGAGIIAKGAGASSAHRPCMAGEPCPAPQMGCGGGMCGCGH